MKQLWQKMTISQTIAHARCIHVKENSTTQSNSNTQNKVHKLFTISDFVQCEMPSIWFGNSGTQNASRLRWPLLQSKVFFYDFKCLFQSNNLPMTIRVRTMQFFRWKFESEINQFLVDGNGKCSKKLDFYQHSQSLWLPLINIKADQMEKYLKSDVCLARVWLNGNSKKNSNRFRSSSFWMHAKFEVCQSLIASTLMKNRSIQQQSQRYVWIQLQANRAY